MTQQSVQASGYFGSVTPKDANEDIITRQRTGGDRRQDADRPRRRPRDLWLIRYALDNTLPLLMVIVLAGAAAGVGVVAWAWTNQERPVQPVSGVSEAQVLAEPRMDGSYIVGGELNSVEKLIASRFGRPLYIGDGGLPVIVVYQTGEIREMTDFEANFPSARPLSVDYGDPPDLEPAMRRYQAPDRDYDGVYFHPGPEGNGVWWLDPARDRPASHSYAVDRLGWQAMQLEMLSEALPAVEKILLSYQDVELSEWDQDWVVNVQEEAERLTERFVGGHHDEWAMVPSRYSCDVALELERTSGVTRGCPSPLLEEALGYMWARYGKLVHSLWALSRVNHPDSLVFYRMDVQSTGVYFTAYAERLIAESALLTASFRDVVHISASEGFNFAALSWLGYPEVLLDTRHSIDY